MTKKTIKIGTRGSKLALWQAETVKSELEKAHPTLQFELKIIKTKGDKILDVALSKIGDKGLFTKEIEQALYDNKIDLAVHSLKDLPTELPENLIVGGMLKRADVRDVFISKDGRKLSEFTASDKIATSSLRRQAQLLHYKPDLQIVDIRGNVETRLKKMNDGHCDALIMAGAGILRLGYDEVITEFLDTDVMLPAVSQGAVAIEIREDDDYTQLLVDAVTDETTRATTLAERSLLRELEGGCQVPVGCFSEVNGDRIKLTGMVASLDGKIRIKKSVETTLDEASEKAIELAQLILDAGGKEILDSIRPSAVD
ncbi:hydroxymethylbilane synthase [Sunxiuqinia dokdonensis]|uniref:Porphobilinogen deaminase n=1 Tax=Sunxiuqinia dokdonensis TaxID=1409788 RepID=A0A0L8V4X9_9BACT|nr:hydroxymethylbilane synthase [Sunxiuqinia dokdonensis]KOH43496.1 porphobilinogen deaminase [Sunxiuqinia dokdonensis]